jgi:hypothetical protein
MLNPDPAVHATGAPQCFVQYENPDGYPSEKLTDKISLL